MQVLDLAQGSAPWHAHRATSRNASDAAAVLGCSPFTTRSELLAAKHTGMRPEPTPEQQDRFDRGHEIEAVKRAPAEQIVGDDLYPCVGVETVGGLVLSASFDGLTMLQETGWECKTLNRDLRAALPNAGPDGNDAANLPKHHRVQMQQQCMVSGATRVLFTASDGREDDRHCWFYPDPALGAEILAAWRQFDADLAAYVPPAASAVEKIVAEPVESLPAPVVQVFGQLTLQDNFKVFEERLRHFLEHRLIRQPRTDEDFVNLDAQIKSMKHARDALKAAEAQMLAQVQPVDQAKKTKDMLDTLLQQNCSMAERLLNSEKERRRGEIVAGGVKALADHIAGLNQRLGKPYMPPVPADFGGCIKGLKSLASMEDKVATELARAKIAANEIADRIHANLNTLRELAKDHAFLFADTSAIVLKAPDDCRALVQLRIAEHRRAEDQRLQEERDRIRREEQELAEQQAAETNRMRMSEISGIQQQVAIATLGRAGVRKGGTIQCIRETLAETEAWPVEESNFGPLTSMAKAAKDKAVADIRDLLADAEERERSAGALAEAAAAASPQPAVAPSTPPAAPSPVANVLPMQRPTPAPAPASQPTLTLGQIGKRLGFNLTADFLKSLGFPAAGRERSAVLFHEQDWPRMCQALIAHVAKASAHQEAA